MASSLKILEKLPDWPAMLDADQAAIFVGLPRHKFNAAVARGRLPAPRNLMDCLLWSKKDIERHLDGAPASLAVSDADDLMDRIDAMVSA